MGESEHISLRLFIESVLDERGKRYDDRFKALEIMLKDALSAQKELTTTIFAASQKAIDRADLVLSDYKVASNEWRQTLNDAYNSMKQEARESAEKNLKEVKISLDKQIDEIKANFNKHNDESIREHAMFVTVKNYDDRHEALNRRVSMLENKSSNLDGRFWALGVGLTVLVIFLNIALKFWFKGY